MAEALKSVRKLIQATAAFFEKRGVDSARLNAERLLGHVLGLARIDLYLNHDRPLAPEEIDRYRELVRQRAAGVPLQTLLGETEFYGRVFQVERGVFIPRPETERLVEAAVRLLTGGTSSWLAPLALEIGCGTGAVACSLAAEIPRLRVHASEIDPLAAALARANARRLGVAARVEVHEAPGAEPSPHAARARPPAGQQPALRAPRRPRGAAARGRRTRPGRGAGRQSRRAGRLPRDRAGGAGVADAGRVDRA
ncbi:MAG: peptide chain release factor N(5)-glutamine methyltransferase [bacterium]|nr:peptide chain release factor N(5)-glutamine methyltransferase [bacterium]